VLDVGPFAVSSHDIPLSITVRMRTRIKPQGTRNQSTILA
jgi:hypothetical protein